MYDVPATPVFLYVRFLSTVVVISPLLRPNFRRVLSRGKVLAFTVRDVVYRVDAVDVGEVITLSGGNVSN